MTIRVAAVEVSHWHALHDAAYLRHLVAMPDVELVAIQDSDADLVARRAAEVGSPPTFKATRLNAFVAVPLAQRYAPFATRARRLLAARRFGPLSHIYVRINRPGPARYPAWDCAWMLDPAEAGGGCLRNLGSHGFDLFLYLTGEDAQVTAAQLSRRTHDLAIEDYASVMLRSESGILGTIEVGNGFPRDGTDGEWKVAGRDGILTMKDGVLKLATAEGDETFPGTDVVGTYFVTVRDALDHWQRGAPPPVSVHDCARVVRLIDEAYTRAAEM